MIREWVSIVSKVRSVCFACPLLRSVIGLNSSTHFRNQTDLKLAKLPCMNFPALDDNMLVLPLSSDWLSVLFVTVVIG